MPLTADQKTEVKDAQTRLQTKFDEATITRYTLREVLQCAADILVETPQDRDLGGNISDARLEALRAHVITKADMLAPVE